MRITSRLERRRNREAIELGRRPQLIERIPTHSGDVLILWTHASFTLHAVGHVTKDGQQDFETHVNVKYANDHAAAVAEAKNMVPTGRRIFFRNLDTGDWSEILN